MKSFLFYYVVFVSFMLSYGLIDKYAFGEPVDKVNNKLFAIAVVICIGISDIRKDLDKWV